jgi:hypothetical protein
MKLTLSDLNACLSREEMTEEPDFKGCLSKIIQFVHTQRERLAQYVGEKKIENAERLADDLIKLWAMEDQRVENCFEIVPVSKVVSKRQISEDRPSDGQKHDPVAEKSLALISEHQVSEPRPERVPEKLPALMSEHQVSESRSEPQISSPGTEKRQRSKDRLDDALVIAPRHVRLVEDLRRIVPASILALEDGTKEDASADRRALAKAEIDRILQADMEGTAILLGDTAEHRRQAFRSIVRLLHPDVGLVSTDDARALKALDVSLKSFLKSELLSQD